MSLVMCPTEDDTVAFGSKLAADLRPGDILTLVGDLGAGKTRLAGGMAVGLGVEEAVASPSFVIVKEYKSGFIPLYHADVYRLSSMAEFEDLDLLQTAADGVLVIEWGNAIDSQLSDDYLEIRLLRHEDESRTLELIPHGSWQDRHLESLQ